MGTRLRPVVKDVPKPMAQVAGRPFLEYLLRWVRSFGFHKVILCVGFQARKVQDHFTDGQALDLEISYSVEDSPLGTWGAIRQAAGLLDESDFLALNGDSWLQVDLADLIRFHVSRRNLATMAVVPVADSSRFGSVQVDPTGGVTAFLEKSAGLKSGLINGGVYVFSREALKLAPPGSSSLEKEVFPALIHRGLYAMPVGGYFVDIGIPDEYVKLQNEAENWIARMGLDAIHGG
jgi:NDP-sugar pyrophosphorylase family protein